MAKEQGKPNGAEKLLGKMNDRAYEEAYDIPENTVRDADYIPEEDEIDHDKDNEIKGR